MKCLGTRGDGPESRWPWLNSPAVWLGLALGLSFAFRLPFVPYTVIDWDESSFALVADSLVRGHLPYTEVAENKPPLIFVFFALIQSIFGKSIVAIRLAGIVLVAITAWLCALISHRAFGLKLWSLAAMVPVVFSSTFAPGSGSTMAEHLAMPFLAAILLMLTADRFEPGRGFLLGLAAALAVMTRSNLAYPALLLAGGVFFLPLEARVRRVSLLAAFAAGALLPLLLLLAAYRHELDTLYRFTVAGPLVYAEGACPLTAAWFREVRSLLALWLGVDLRALAWISAGGLGWAMVRSSGPARRMTLIVALGWIATMAGICAGGRIFGHYLMQLLPFSVPFFAVALARLGSRHRWATGLLLIALLTLWGEPVARKYVHHGRRVAAGEPLWNDPATQLVRYLDQAGARGKPLFLLDAHAAYWLLDSVPPSRVGHPSNLGRTAMIRALEGAQWTACREFDAIFAQHPIFVVHPKDMTKLGFDAPTRACLQAHLDQAYRPDRSIQELQIYRRTNATSAYTITE